MIVRQETSGDYDEVYGLVKEAFASAEHSDGNEHDLVAALRKSAAFVPELSLVAEADGKIVGHILFTEAIPCSHWPRSPFCPRIRKRASARR